MPDPESLSGSRTSNPGALAWLWQFKARSRLARVKWLSHRLPWRAWCWMCAWTAPDVVAEIARRSDRPLNFLQIGSCDGVANDPLHDVIRTRGWIGVLVEPMPDRFERLVANYAGMPNIRFSQVAVGTEDTAVVMYSVTRREGDPEWADQIASLDRDVIARHAYAISDLESRITETTVESVRLPTLVSRLGLTTLDLVHVDAEGHDADIVDQLDLHSDGAPRFVLFEKKHLSQARLQETTERMRKAGYRVVNLWPDELAYRPGSRMFKTR